MASMAATSSSFQDVVVPDLDMWAFFFERPGRLFPDDKVLFVDANTGQSCTFSQLRDLSSSFGNELRSNWGWEKGHVLAVYCPNSIDTASVVFGCLRAGGVVTTVNPLYNADELAFQLKDSHSRGIVTTVELLSTSLNAADTVGLPHHRILILGNAAIPSEEIKHFTSFASESSAEKYPFVPSAPDDLAFLVYSSGTTGLPKGVMLSHRNINVNLLQLQASEGDVLSWTGGVYGGGDKMLAVVPFFHIYGLVTVLLQTIYYGLTTFTMARFDLSRFCELVQKQRITYCNLVPPIILLLSKHPVVSKYDLSSLRMINSAAAPLTSELIQALWDRLKIPVKQGYGLSETSPCTHAQLWGDWQSSIGSIGKLVPSMKAKVVDKEGKIVPVGKRGELLVSGPNVFRGYLNKPDATKAAFTEDGYFKTGDIVYMNETGDFFVSDRIKELIKVMGHSVAPAELEGLLLTHPKVRDAAVISVRDEERASEAPRGYIVLRPDITPADDVGREIAEWLARKVSSYKQLRGGVEFIDEIPKSPAGKILRRVLKTNFEKKQQQNIKAKL